MCAYIQREAKREVGMDGWIWICNMKITRNRTSEAKGDQGEKHRILYEFFTSFPKLQNL